MGKINIDKCRGNIQLSNDTIKYRTSSSWVHSEQQLQQDIISIACIKQSTISKNNKELDEIFNHVTKEIEKKTINKKSISNHLIKILNIIQEDEIDIEFNFSFPPMYHKTHEFEQTLKNQPGITQTADTFSRNEVYLSGPTPGITLLQKYDKKIHKYVLSPEAKKHRSTHIDDRTQKFISENAKSIKFIGTETADTYNSKVLTVFNHGTGASSKKSAERKELINLIGNKFKGSKEITEGIGSIGDPDRIRYFIDSENKLQKIQIGKNSKGARIYNEAKGVGLQNNVDNLMIKLRWLKLHNKLPSTINMAGWSRGGVTSIRQANAIYKEFPNIKINIFAIDPVGGLLKNFDHDNHNLPPNVKNFTATLAEHERRLAFAPVDKSFITNTPKTNVTFLPFPGVHGDLARFDNDSGKINADLMVRFLSEHKSLPKNTEIFKTYTMNEQEKSKTYQSLQTARNSPNEYKLQKNDRVKLSNSVAKQLQSGGGNFNIRINVDKYIDNPKFFINEDQKINFRKLYPNVYDFYFKGNSKINQDKLSEELNKIPIKKKLFLQNIDTSSTKKYINNSSAKSNPDDFNLDAINKRILKEASSSTKQTIQGRSKALNNSIEPNSNNKFKRSPVLKRKLSLLKNDYNILVQYSSKIASDNGISSDPFSIHSIMKTPQFILITDNSTANT